MVLDGTVINGQIVLEPSQPALSEGAKVRVELVDEPTLGLLLKYTGMANGLPADFAENRDHYLHGKPKNGQCFRRCFLVLCLDQWL
jgi:hypothetical protein